MCDLPLYIVDIFIYILVAGQLCFDLISCGNRGLYAIYNMIICLTRYIFSVKRLNIYHHFLCPKIYIITFKRGFKTLIKFGIRLSQCNISIKVQGETRVQRAPAFFFWFTNFYITFGAYTTKMMEHVFTVQHIIISKYLL